ncbi:hypothetical protein [Streptomyces inhibens]|uniref:hypothetical protein n=1 Tax=Streptomyces inhibens TaxID=2293571 RepID=UPI001EE7513A|nr:hypothetical protein [Streptomyces inhibens]UKY47580.1 hypothetical protein KI385_01120 [Streptomyces inhibens]
MAPNNGGLWRVARGQNSEIYNSLWFNSSWLRAETPAGWRSTHGLGLAAHEGKPWTFLRGEDRLLHTASYLGQWSNATLVSGQAAKPMDEPTAASHKYKLYVMYRAARD